MLLPCIVALKSQIDIDGIIEQHPSEVEGDGEPLLASLCEGGLCPVVAGAFGAIRQGPVVRFWMLLNRDAQGRIV